MMSRQQSFHDLVDIPLQKNNRSSTLAAQPTTESLLAWNILAYRQGKCLPVPMPPAVGIHSQQRVVSTFLQQMISRSELHTSNTVMHLLALAGNLRRQSLFAQSRLMLQDAARYLEDNTQAESSLLFGRARISQAAAELDFQLGDFSKVQENLSKSLEQDHVLEQEYLLVALHSYRLEQILLWIRACAAMGQTARAVELAQEAVLYLLSLKGEISLSQGWDENLAWKIPEETRSSLLAQFASLTGGILSNELQESASELFFQFYAWKLFDGHGALEEIHSWGLIKEAYLTQDWREFLTLCQPFLQSGRKQTLLWDTAVLDLCQCCKLLRPRQTQGFLEEVASNTARMWDIPPGGYSLPTGIYYKRIFVIKDFSFPAFVLPPELRRPLQDLAASPGQNTKPSAISPRRFHAYNVGLPRSGCSSIMALFGNYRSVAEYKEQESVELITAWKDGWISQDTLRRYILHRHRVGQLEMDTASFNHFYLHILLQEFPQARFIFTIRDCYSWVNSFLKMISRWKKHFLDIGQDMPDWMLNYGRILFGKYDWTWFNSYQNLQKNLDPLVEMFIKSWADYNLRALDMLPPDRSMILRTSEISSSQERLARFVGIPADSITDQHHINIAPDSLDLLQDFDRDRFDALCFKYGQQVLERVFPEQCIKPA